MTKHEDFVEANERSEAEEKKRRFKDWRTWTAESEPRIPQYPNGVRAREGRKHSVFPSWRVFVFNTPMSTVTEGELRLKREEGRLNEASRVSGFKY